MKTMKKKVLEQQFGSACMEPDIKIPGARF